MTAWYTHPLVVGTASGAVVSGVLLFVLLRTKAAGFKQRAAAFQVSGGVADQLKARLKTYAEQRATALARQTAENHLSNTYGLTPDRIARIGRLAATLSGR